MSNYRSQTVPNTITTTAIISSSSSTSFLSVTHQLINELNEQEDDEKRSMTAPSTATITEPPFPAVLTIIPVTIHNNPYRYHHDFQVIVIMTNTRTV